MDEWKINSLLPIVVQMKKWGAEKIGQLLKNYILFFIAIVFSSLTGALPSNTHI